MGSIGIGELMLIFLAALLIFGAKRIPEIARGLGQGIREFRAATQDISREIQYHEVRQPTFQRPEPEGIVSRVDTPAEAEAQRKPTPPTSAS